MRSIKFIGALALAVFIAVFATTVFACTLDSQCSGNPCLTGICDLGTNLCVTVADNTSCADADLCNGDETCQGGVCTPGTPVVCAAPAACKATGVCQTGTGLCTYANLADGTKCNADTNKCTGSPNTTYVNDSCTNGVCVVGALKSCDLGNPCKNYGVCAPATGNCPVATNKAAGTACSDNNLCTTGDACNASGTCVGALKNCADANVCTIDSCDTTTGNCVNQLVTPCDALSCSNPLKAMTKLKITQGSGSATNVPCSVGSCFAMDQGPGNVVWTDFGPGTDFGIVVGKTQTSGGQEGTGGGTITTPGQLSAVWNFFSNNGTFFTSPTVTLPYDGGSLNKFCGSPCASADCIGKTELKVFNVAWNGNVIPMGSQLGCTHANCSTAELNNVFVNDWQINPVAGGAWSINYTQVVPSGTFTGVRFTAIMRGTVEPSICDKDIDCNDGKACTDDTCDTATGICVFTPNTNVCTTDITLVYPSNGQTGLRTTLEFRWEKITDPDNAPITYKLYLCTDPTFTTTTDASCAPITVASRSSNGVFYAGGAGLFMIGMTFFGGLRGKKRIVLLFMVLVLFAGGTIISCKAKDDTELPANQMNHIATGLSAGTTYYWKVTADNGKIGGKKGSAVWSFTTE